MSCFTWSACGIRCISSFEQTFDFRRCYNMYEKEKDLTLLRRFALKIRLVPTMSSPILMTNEFFTSFMGAYLFPSTSMCYGANRALLDQYTHFIVFIYFCY